MPFIQGILISYLSINLLIINFQNNNILLISYLVNWLLIIMIKKIKWIKYYRLSSIFLFHIYILCNIDKLYQLNNRRSCHPHPPQKQTFHSQPGLVTPGEREGGQEVGGRHTGWVGWKLIEIAKFIKKETKQNWLKMRNFEKV